MRDQIKRILSEVAGGPAGLANRNKKVIGGLGAAGAAGALSSDQAADFYRRGIGLGRRVMQLGEAVEKAEGGGDNMPDYPSVHPETLRYRP